MTFWSDEKSTESSVPVELHHFTDGTDDWYYTDGPTSESYGGNTWASATIRGEKIENTGNITRNVTKVTCDWDLAFASQYIQSPPDAPVTYTRYKLQGSNAITIYHGVVSSVSFEQQSRRGKRSVTIDIIPQIARAAVNGLTLRYDRKCSVALYSTLCGVDKDSFKITGTLSAVDGTTLTASAFSSESSGWLDGGYINVYNHTRKILTHSGSSIVISHIIYGLSDGEAFTAYAGCNRTTDCASKFDNLNNQRAHPNIPEEENNPFGDNGVI